MSYLESPVPRFLHIVDTGMLTVSTCNRFFLKSTSILFKTAGGIFVLFTKVNLTVSHLNHFCTQVGYIWVIINV